MSDPDHIDKNDENLRCGIKTALKSTDGIMSLHVGWIEWDSGFRGTGLRVGDDIVAVDALPIIADPSSSDFKGQIGMDLESANWRKMSASDGRPVKLTVRRRRILGVGWETVDIKGSVRTERLYLNAEGRRLMGDGGPQRLQNDGFSDSWASWYERRVYVWERQLDGFIWDNHGDSRMALADHLADKARVEFLHERYPGAFGRAVFKDWHELNTLLAGRAYVVDPKEWLFREDEQKIRIAATAAANTAWAKFLADNEANLIEHPGGLSVVHSDFDKLQGKLLNLPPSAPEQWITDVGKPYVAWQLNGGWAVAALESASFQRAWRAQSRYRHNVSPAINDEVSIVGRIVSQPRLIHPGGDEAAVIALEVEPIAARIGDSETAMFVNLQGTDSEAPFAGEENVRALPVPALPENAEPQQVMETLFDALHARDDKKWFSLFARWQVLVDEGRSYYYPYSPYPEARKDTDWTKSRRTVLAPCFALRVVWTDDPVDISPKGIDGMPRIERVIVEIDHVGQFDGEYRAYNSVEVHRHWHLGRIDGGPWRIMTQQGI
jgi:hypothetical protein